MARAIWKGSITFGLVNIPVGLYSAEQRQEISFHLLDRKNMARVRYKRVNETSDKEVAWGDTVRGYEYEEGQYVVLTDEDLQRASPEKTQTVDILDFVDLEDIDPRFFDKPYYLAPEKRGAKSYALLRETLRRTGKAGIASVVIRTKQYLAALTVHEEVMVLNILRYNHELRDWDSLDLPKGKEGVSDREIEMAERLVEGMVSKWDPDRYKDTYAADMMAMIKQRIKSGKTEEIDETPVERQKGDNVVDLMALLKQSVEDGGSKRSSSKAAKKTAAKKPAARKAPVKRASSSSASKRKKSA